MVIIRLKPTVIPGRLDEWKDISLRKLLHSANFSIVLCYFFFYLVACQYCYYAYSREPTSFFFNPSKGYRRVYSLKRELQADAFIEAANRSSSPIKPQETPSICLGTSRLQLQRTCTLLVGTKDDLGSISTYTVPRLGHRPPSKRRTPENITHTHREICRRLFLSHGQSLRDDNKYAEQSVI